MSAIFGLTVDQTISTLNTQVMTMSTQMQTMSSHLAMLLADVEAIKNFLGVVSQLYQLVALSSHNYCRCILIFLENVYILFLFSHSHSFFLTVSLAPLLSHICSPLPLPSCPLTPLPLPSPLTASAKPAFYFFILFHAFSYF